MVKPIGFRSIYILYSEDSKHQKKLDLDELWKRKNGCQKTVKRDSFFDSKDTNNKTILPYF